MTRKGSFVLVAALASTLTWGASAQAGGWGPYFEWGRDWSKLGLPSFLFEELLNEVPEEYQSTAEDILKNAKIDMTIDHYTIGACYDSAPSQDKLFNFRIAFGFDFARDGKLVSTTGIDVPAYLPPDVQDDLNEIIQIGEDTVNAVLATSSTYGGTVHMTFGFSPIRTSLLKWWVGPGIRFNGNYYEVNVNIDGEDIPHGATLEAGGGVETGVNFHVGPLMSLCVAAGFHWNAFGMAATNSDFDAGGFVWGNGPFCFVQASVLFHTGKDYGAWSGPAPEPKPAAGPEPTAEPEPQPSPSEDDSTWVPVE